MSDNETPLEEEKIACTVCLKEVPVSEAMNEEATDYVFHFCGLECYEKWKEQNTDKND